MYGFVFFQERFDRIAEELRQLGERVEDLKNAAIQAKDANDINSFQAITSQLEMIQLRQARLLQEQHHEFRLFNRPG